MLVQRRRRWADVVQMLYKCFVSAGILLYVLSYTHSVYCLFMKTQNEQYIFYQCLKYVIFHAKHGYQPLQRRIIL